jgi:hypothetical protein
MSARLVVSRNVTSTSEPRSILHRRYRLSRVAAAVVTVGALAAPSVVFDHTDGLTIEGVRRHHPAFRSAIPRWRLLRRQRIGR